MKYLFLYPVNIFIPNKQGADPCAGKWCVFVYTLHMVSLFLTKGFV